MQSVKSTSSQATPDCLNFGGGDDDSKVFLSENERSEDPEGHSRLALSFSGLERSSTKSEQEKENKSVGGTQGDLLFAQKCLELQGFIGPLLELLNGLKKGRFDKGLSSFQQSVAMDRIQRIVGVLQKPHIGEKYLPTLLQVEMMLKLWFPQVSLKLTGTSEPTQLSGQGPSSSSSSSSSTPLQREQLHIPVKKRRLIWSDADSVASKCLHMKVQKIEQSQCLSPATQVDQFDKRSKKKSGPMGLFWTEPGMTWVHVAPILSPPKSCPSINIREAGAKDINSGHFLLAPPYLSSRGSPATQDNSISSTTPCGEPETHQIQPEELTRTEWHSQSLPITEQLSSLLQT